MAPEKSNGALIGSIVIIVILIIGGIYLWKTSLKEKAMPLNSNVSQNGDSAANIETSLNSMDMNGLDNGI